MKYKKNKDSLHFKNKKRAWNCDHSKLKHYAKGKCRECYLNKYYEARRDEKLKQKQNIEALLDADYDMGVDADIENSESI